MSVKEGVDYVFYLGLGGVIICVGRKDRWKMVEWERGFFCWVSTSADKRTSLELHTAFFISCPSFSPAYMLRVSRTMNCISPLLTTLLSYEGSLTRPSLPGSWQVKEWVELAYFILKWKKSRKAAAAEIGCSSSLDTSHFPALMPTDTKTNIKERNK